MKLQQLDTFATAHHGLITRLHARQLGIDRNAWHRAIASHQLQQLYPGVARLWGSPATLRQHALAAVWATGPAAMTSAPHIGCVVAGRATCDDPIDVLSTRRTTSARRGDIVVHRPRDLVDIRPVLHDKVPTTNPLRMLLNLGAIEGNMPEGCAGDDLGDVVEGGVAHGDPPRRCYATPGKGAGDRVAIGTRRVVRR